MSKRCWPRRGWLTEWFSPLGRHRWYRMSMLAGILLAPLAAVGIETIAQIAQGIPQLSDGRCPF